MKKSLFAVAALSAIAGTAQAQSSVTVYGLLDMGYIGSNAREVSAAGAVTKVQKSAFGNGAENTSRLGFRGTEDLGGGTSAFFTVEMGLTPQNSELSGGVSKDAVQGTNQASGSAVDNRQSFVGLKKNGLGQFAFGRQYTLIFNAAAATDPGQLNNVVGNVVYNSGSAYTADNNASGTNNNIGFTNRASNTITASSAKFAGFGINGMYAMNNTNATQTAAGNSTAGGGNSNWNGWGLSADYTWQKLYLTVAYQSFKTQLTNGVYAASGTTLNANSVGPVSGQLSSNGAIFAPTQLADKQTYVAGTYDFGILKAYLQWSGRKVQNDTTSSVYIGNAAAATAVTSGQQLSRTAQQVGVRSFITPTVEAWGSIGNGKYTGAIATTGLPASVNYVGWQLGSNYYLSKRTNLYAIYGQQQTSSVTGGTNGSGATANQYALGVRHTF